jgi:N-succinyl-L-ornithine transcarbamylase
MRHFLSVDNVTNLNILISQAFAFKKNPRQRCTLGSGKRLGLIFLNPSLRTRISTQMAASNLGLETIVFNIDKEGWKLEFEDGVVMNGDSVEHIKDAAPVLGSYFDILAIRTFPSLKNKEDDYNELYIHQFVKYSGIPVLSLESATLHPLQSLADLITMEEYIQKENMTKRPKVVLTWSPHIKPLPQCVANSFSQWVNCWKKADFVIAQPEGYELDEKFTNGAIISYDQEEALQGADFVYVKNWSSYRHYGAILPGDHTSWMLNMERLNLTNNARVMHCLPVRRNVELGDDILDGPNSLVTQQAENRVWAAQSVLENILEGML